MSLGAPHHPVPAPRCPPHAPTLGLLLSLLGRDRLLQVPELERAVLGSSEQSRLAVMESQGADAIVVGAEGEFGVPGLLKGILAVRQLGWGSCLSVCSSISAVPQTPTPSPTRGTSQTGLQPGPLPLPPCPQCPLTHSASACSVQGLGWLLGRQRGAQTLGISPCRGSLGETIRSSPQRRGL